MKIFSIEKILRIAGGPAGLRDLMRAAGQPAPGDANIYMWRKRSSLPGKWSGAVIYTLARKKRISPLSLLVETEITAEELGL